MYISSVQQIPTLNLAGRLADTISNQSSLIYVYPFIIENRLKKKWEMLLRDFQSAQFVNQIKTSNILNIVQTISNTRTAESDIIKQLVYNLNTSSENKGLIEKLIRDLVQQQTFQSQTVAIEYQRRTLEIQNYIKSQILNDPRYQNLRPVFSLISLENNFIDIPLIIGTKSYTVDTYALFWILFVSVMRNNPAGLVDIRNVLNIVQNLTVDQYRELLKNPNFVPINIYANLNQNQILNNRNLLSQLMRFTSKELEKAVKIFNRVAGSISEFEADIGFGTNMSSDSVTYTAIHTQSSAEFSQSIAAAKTNINNEVVRLVFPLMQNFNNLFVNPAFNIDFNTRYSMLIDSINQRAETVFNDFEAHVRASLQNVDDVQVVLNLFEKNCTEISSSELIQSVISEVDNLTIMYRDIFNWGAQQNIVNMIEKINRTSFKLSGLRTRVLQVFERLLNNNNFSAISRNLLDDIKNDLHTFYNHPNARQNIFDYNNPQVSPQIQQIFPNAQPNDVLAMYVGVIEALTSIIQFLIIYHLIKSLCNYVSIINSKINIRSRDVVKFPNYTLVIPIEFARMLYFALASRNFADTMQNINNPQNLDPNFKLSETDISKIVSAIIDKLKVPNAIVVDDKKNEIYYRWGFLKKVFKISESTIHSYLKSQQSVIRAF